MNYRGRVALQNLLIYEPGCSRTWSEPRRDKSPSTRDWYNRLYKCMIPSRMPRVTSMDIGEKRHLNLCKREIKIESQLQHIHLAHLSIHEIVYTSRKPTAPIRNVTSRVVSTRQSTPPPIDCTITASTTFTTAASSRAPSIHVPSTRTHWDRYILFARTWLTCMEHLLKRHQSG
jgi:hypothetical protein